MIPFPSPLEKVTLMKRYKRFLADVRQQDGSLLTVHCANSGSMLTCFEPGWNGWISDSGNPKRKLRYTLEYTESPAAKIGVNTAKANHVILESLQKQQIPEMAGYQNCKGEVGFTKGTRFDGAFWDGKKTEPAGYFEIKTVSLCRNNTLSFPDAVTTRGQKHLKELMNVRKQGLRAILIFLIMRTDGTVFQAADDIDATYAALLKKAESKGVEILVYRAKLSPEGISLGARFKRNRFSTDLRWIA